MSALDLRAQLARDLAHVNAVLGAVSLDGPALHFATPEERVQFQAGIQRARREVTAAELVVLDLVLGEPVTTGGVR